MFDYFCPVALEQVEPRRKGMGSLSGEVVTGDGVPLVVQQGYSFLEILLDHIVDILHRITAILFDDDIFRHSDIGNPRIGAGGSAVITVGENGEQHKMGISPGDQRLSYL